MSEDEEEGPPDPQLHPANSPGVGPDEASDVTVSRADVDVGTADPAELTAGDTEPVEDSPVGEVCSDLLGGDPTERKRAAIELGQRDGSQTVLDTLATAAREDPDADVRQFAVEALGNHGGETATAVASDALDDPDPWVRAEAVVALDHTDREGNRERVAECLDDAHHAVRRNALITLWKLGDPNVFDEAVALVEDESSRVREWAAIVLGELDADRAEPELRRLAGDTDDVVARAAMEALDGGRTAEGSGGPAPKDDRFDRPPTL